jgi:hypothetical protein
MSLDTERGWWHHLQVFSGGTTPIPDCLTAGSLLAFQRPLLGEVRILRQTVCPNWLCPSQHHLPCSPMPSPSDDALTCSFHVNILIICFIICSFFCSSFSSSSSLFFSFFFETWSYCVAQAGLKFEIFSYLSGGITGLSHHTQLYACFLFSLYLK